MYGSNVLLLNIYDEDGIRTKPSPIVTNPRQILTDHHQILIAPPSRTCRRGHRRVYSGPTTSPLLCRRALSDYTNAGVCSEESVEAQFAEHGIHPTHRE